jgi:hypothetical protein
VPEDICMLVDQRRRLIKAKYPRLWNLLLSQWQLVRSNKFGHFLSTQKFVTAWTGPLYERNCHVIQLDLTFDCNLKCFNCERCCGLAPSKDCLSLEQIRQFLWESTEMDVRWKTIRVLGGEPTLHPEFLSIIEELLIFKKSQCPEVTIEVYSNGFGKKVNDVLARVSGGVVVYNSAKKSREQKHQPFTLAPKDSICYRYADFSCGCWLISYCGMGLSPYGYYPCGPAASIDRVFGFNIGKKSLPGLADPMRDQMVALCRYCGYFRFYWPIWLDRDLISQSWRRALKNYQVSKPIMTLYR